MSEKEAKQAVDAMATAATTLREAISASLPVSPTQLMTVQVPGTIIDPSEYLWNPNETTFPPLTTRIAESRLVDGQVPISKIMMGRTGKSVARSYMATLDCLVSTEAALSSAITSSSENLDARQRAVKTRYDNAKQYLTQKDPSTEGGTSRLTVYVQKQKEWSTAVEKYNTAQVDQQRLAQTRGLSIDKQRQDFLEWMQANGRDFKAAIQAKYMDWVVHGFKFEVEFYFGVVDVSSAMKRVESSKEAFRNLTLLAADGASEYSGVNLTPRNWATLVKETIDSWSAKKRGPSPLDLEAEIRRLNNILISTTALRDAVKNGTFTPSLIQKGDGVNQTDLESAYVGAYETYNEEIKKYNKEIEKNKKPSPLSPYVEKAFDNDLQNKQTAFTGAQVNQKKGLVAANTDGAKAEAEAYLEGRLKTLNDDIKGMKERLAKVTGVADTSTIVKPEVRDEKGAVVDERTARAHADLLKNYELKEEPSPWTRITAKVSQSKSEATKSTAESSSSFAAKAGWGLWSVSAGASHASASAKAASSTANLDVSIAMDCMLVEIERPWLHAELFADHELDAAPGFDISPGPAELQEAAERHRPVRAEYTQFASYPTAFVLAANVELEFTGDTTLLESAVASSSTEANVSVGYGPFSVSGSHKSSKSSSKTHAESTATGMRISLQAPQIIAWVQELLPQLPKPKGPNSALFGMALEPMVPSVQTSDLVPKPSAATDNTAGTNGVDKKTDAAKPGDGTGSAKVKT